MYTKSLLLLAAATVAMAQADDACSTQLPDESAADFIYRCSSLNMAQAQYAADNFQELWDAEQHLSNQTLKEMVHGMPMDDLLDWLPNNIQDFLPEDQAAVQSWLDGVNDAADTNSNERRQNDDIFASLTADGIAPSVASKVAPLVTDKAFQQDLVFIATQTAEPVSSELQALEQGNIATGLPQLASKASLLPSGDREHFTSVLNAFAAAVSDVSKTTGSSQLPQPTITAGPRASAAAAASSAIAACAAQPSGSFSAAECALELEGVPGNAASFLASHLTGNDPFNSDFTIIAAADMATNTASGSDPTSFDATKFAADLKAEITRIPTADRAEFTSVVDGFLTAFQAGQSKASASAGVASSAAVSAGGAGAAVTGGANTAVPVQTGAVTARPAQPTTFATQAGLPASANGTVNGPASGAPRGTNGPLASASATGRVVTAGASKSTTAGLMGAVVAGIAGLAFYL